MSCFVCPVNVGTNPGLAALWEDEKQRRRDRGESSQITPPESQGTPYLYNSSVCIVLELWVGWAWGVWKNLYIHRPHCHPAHFRHGTRHSGCSMASFLPFQPIQYWLVPTIFCFLFKTILHKDTTIHPCKHLYTVIVQTIVCSCLQSDLLI